MRNSTVRFGLMAAAFAFINEALVRRIEEGRLHDVQWYLRSLAASLAKERDEDEIEEQVRADVERQLSALIVGSLAASALIQRVGAAECLRMHQEEPIGGRPGMQDVADDLRWEIFRGPTIPQRRENN